MTSHFGIEDLEALGLRGATVVASEEFSWPDREAAEGSKIGVVALTLIQLLPFARFRSVNVSLAERLAIHLEADIEHRGVVRITLAPGVDVADVRGLPEGGVRIDSDDRGIASLDLRNAARAA